MATKKKTEKKMAAIRVTRQSAATAHEQEFAQTIMAPKFWELLVDHNFDLTYTTLTTVYNTAHGTRLSATSIKKYLDLLGWKYRRTPQWTGLPNIDDTTNTVDTAGILRAPDEEAVDPTRGHAVGNEIPGGALSPEDQALLR